MARAAEWTYDLCGGHLALDFANTVSDRHTTTPIDRVPTPHDLVAFARQTGLVSEAERARLLRELRRDPAHGAEAHVRALALREALYATFAAIARGERPGEQDLERISEHHAKLRLGPDLAWHARAPGTLEALLAPIVRAGVALLTSEQRERVRLCEADDCVWLFLDTSKNRSRRWCDMAQCGNRAKARRHYARMHPKRRAAVRRSP